jgi:hypothetical protein
MKHKPWEVEAAFTLLKALEGRLAPIGFHVATVGTERLTKLGELHLRIYGDAMTDADRANIVSLLQATEMRLVHGVPDGTAIGEETWSYGRGKNEQLVGIIFD